MATFPAAPVATDFEEQAQHSLLASLRDATRTLIGENQISAMTTKLIMLTKVPQRLPPMMKNGRVK